MCVIYHLHVASRAQGMALSLEYGTVGQAQGRRFNEVLMATPAAARGCGDSSWYATRPRGSGPQRPSGGGATPAAWAARATRQPSDATRASLSRTGGSRYGELFMS